MQQQFMVQKSSSLEQKSPDYFTAILIDKQEEDISSSDIFDINETKQGFYRTRVTQQNNEIQFQDHLQENFDSVQEKEETVELVQIQENQQQDFILYDQQQENNNYSLLEAVENQQYQQQYLQQYQEQQQYYGISSISNQFQDAVVHNISSVDISLLTTQMLKLIQDEERELIQKAEIQNVFDMDQIMNKNYQKLEKIGKGATSEVFKSICFRRNRFFSLKEFKKCHQDAFFQEIYNVQLIQKLLQQQQDLKQYLNGFYYVINFNKQQIGYDYGQIDLKQFIQKYREIGYQFKDRDYYFFLVQIKNLMERFYRVGLIYTDLKPENLILSSEITQKSIYGDQYIQPYIPYKLKFIDMGSFVQNIKEQRFFFNRMSFDKSNNLENQRDLEYLLIYMTGKCLLNIIGDIENGIKNDKFREFLGNITIRWKKRKEFDRKPINFEEFDEQLNIVFRSLFQENQKKDIYQLINEEYIFDIKLQVVKFTQQYLQTFGQKVKGLISREKLDKLFKNNAQLQEYYYFYLNEEKSNSVENNMKLVKFQINNRSELDHLFNVQDIKKNLRKIHKLMQQKQKYLIFKEEKEDFQIQCIKYNYFFSRVEIMGSNFQSSMEILLKCLKKVNTILTQQQQQQQQQSQQCQQQQGQQQQKCQYLKLKSQILMKIFEVYNSLEQKQINYLGLFTDKDFYIDEAIDIQNKNEWYRLCMLSYKLKGDYSSIVYSRLYIPQMHGPILENYDKALQFYQKFVEQKGEEHTKRKGFLKLQELNLSKVQLFRTTFGEIEEVLVFLVEFIRDLMNYYQNPVKIPIIQFILEVAQVHEILWEKNKFLAIMEQCENLIKVSIQQGIIKQTPFYEELLDQISLKTSSQYVIVNPFKASQRLEYLNNNYQGQGMYYSFVNQIKPLRQSCQELKKLGEEMSKCEKTFILGQSYIMNSLYYDAFGFAVQEEFEKCQQFLDQICCFYKKNDKLSKYMKPCFDRLQASIYFCQGKYDACLDALNCSSLYDSRLKNYSDCCGQEYEYEYELEDCTLKQKNVYAVNYLYDLNFNFFLAALEMEGYIFNEKLSRTQKFRSFQDRCLDVVEFIKKKTVFGAEIEPFLIWTYQFFKFTRRQRIIYKDLFGKLIEDSRFEVIQLIISNEVQ